jgi:hypothetical protein
MYIRRLDEFRSFQLKDEHGKVITQDYFVFDMSDNKYLWVRTGVREEGRLHLFNFKTGSSEILGNIEGQRNILLKDKTGSGFAVLSSMRTGDSGFMISDLLPSNKIKTHNHYFDGVSSSYPKVKTYNAMQTSDSIIWVGSDRGLIEFNARTKKYNIYCEQYGKIKSASSHKDKLFLSTLGHGVLVFDVVNKQVVNQFLPEDKNAYSIRYPSISKVTVDQFECLWVSYFEDGTAGGVDYADLNKNRFPLIESFIRDEVGVNDLAIGAPNNLYVATGSTIIQYTNSSVANKWAVPGEIQKIKSFDKNNLLVVFKNNVNKRSEIARLNVQDGAFKYYVESSTLQILDLEILPDGLILAATTSGVYELVKQDTDDYQLELFQDMNAVANTWILHMHRITDNIIAIASNVNNLHIYKKDNGSFSLMSSIKDIGNCNSYYYFKRRFNRLDY